MTPSRQRHEAQAVKVLEQLRGYMFKAGWRDHDREYIANLLQEWDEQVTQLLVEREALIRRNRDQAELIRRYEWRLATRGWGNYLKFLIGARSCP